ncbi:MAG: hypothetical protein IPP26_01500 [Flavobacteriales bacterium]|nr:hypothetical protein [Flavobacteriales bacterium]
MTPTTGIFLPTSKHSVIATGTYVLLVTDANGCTDTDTANVTVTGLEDMAVVQDTSMCMFQTVQLTGGANGGTAPHTFLWTPATALSATNIPDPISSAIHSITYVLTVTDQVGCTDTDSLTVIVFPLPVVDADRTSAYVPTRPCRCLAVSPRSEAYGALPRSSCRIRSLLAPIPSATPTPIRSRCARTQIASWSR